MSQREKNQLRSGLQQILMHYHKVANRALPHEKAVLETISMAFGQLKQFATDGKYEDALTSAVVAYMLELSKKRFDYLTHQENPNPDVIDDWQAFIEWLKGMQEYLPQA